MPQHWTDIPAPYPFNPDADLTGPILQTLNSANPAATICDEWPWMRGNPAVADFVDEALRLRKERSEDLPVVVERFAGVIRVEHHEDAQHRPWLFRRKRHSG